MAQTDCSPSVLPKYATSNPISVTVDKAGKQQKFFVHESLLIHASQYFQTALSSGFQEGETKSFFLEEDDARAFNLFVQYLYTNNYDATLAVSPAEGGTSPVYLRMHAAAYALGNKLMAPRFQRLVLYKVALVLTPDRNIDMKLVLDVASTIYEGTSTDNGHDMRAIMAKYCASRFGHYEGMIEKSWSKEEITALVDAQLPEFVADVMGEMRGAGIFSAPASLNSPKDYQVERCWKFRG